MNGQAKAPLFEYVFMFDAAVYQADLKVPDCGQGKVVAAIRFAS